MVAHRGAQVLKLAPRRGSRAAPRHIGCASLGVELVKPLAAMLRVAEIIEQLGKTRRHLLWPRIFRRHVFGIDRDDIGDYHLRRMTVAVARDFPLGLDVVGEGVLEFGAVDCISAVTRALAEAKALFELSVSDAPHAPLDELPGGISPWLLPVEFGTSFGIRHSVFIR